MTGESTLRLTLTEGKYTSQAHARCGGNRVEGLHRSAFGALTLPQTSRPASGGGCPALKPSARDNPAHASISWVPPPRHRQACALTIGNFDGVHRGHQAMLALLKSEAQHRGLPSCVMTFEPHPRDYFAAMAGKPETAPARIATLRDKLSELERCGIDQVVVLRFAKPLATQSAQSFIEDVLVRGLGTRYILWRRLPLRRQSAGDYAMLDTPVPRRDSTWRA